MSIKPIKIDAAKLMEDIETKMEQQAKDALEKQVNEILNDVRCPEHHQRPKIELLDPVMSPRRNRNLRYRVMNLCCQKLVEEVENKIGKTISLTVKD